MIRTYADQVKAEAAKARVDLKLAFAMARLPESTYYRFLKGEKIRLETANRLMTAISWLNGAVDPATKHLDGTTGQGGK
jgi:predicted transcriptional regulator